MVRFGNRNERAHDRPVGSIAQSLNGFTTYFRHIVTRDQGAKRFNGPRMLQVPERFSGRGAHLDCLALLRSRDEQLERGIGWMPLEAFDRFEMDVLGVIVRDD